VLLVLAADGLELDNEAVLVVSVVADDCTLGPKVQVHALNVDRLDSVDLRARADVVPPISDLFGFFLTK
jgi:hypothetical protein